VLIIITLLSHLSFIPPPPAPSSPPRSDINMCGVTAGETRKVLCWGESKAVAQGVPPDLEPAGGMLVLDF
jgi:hypothetical protein